MTPPPPSIRPHENSVVTAVPVSEPGRYQDNRVDVKLVLSGMWMIAMLFASAYVDIFAFFRKDVLRDGVDGPELSGMTQPADQMVLTAALLYILVPSLMVASRSSSGPRPTESPTWPSASSTRSLSRSRASARPGCTTSWAAPPK
jgi:hypothetical protein